MFGDINPHEARIQSEYSYASSHLPHLTRIQIEHDYTCTDPPQKKKRRILPQSVIENQTAP